MEPAQIITVEPVRIVIPTGPPVGELDHHTRLGRPQGAVVEGLFDPRTEREASGYVRMLVMYATSLGWRSITGWSLSRPLRYPGWGPRHRSWLHRALDAAAVEGYSEGHQAKGEEEPLFYVESVLNLGRARR